MSDIKPQAWCPFRGDVCPRLKAAQDVVRDIMRELREAREENERLRRERDIDIREVIHVALKKFRCHYLRDEDDDGAELVDVLSDPDADDITTGKEELFLLADFIAGELDAAWAGEEQAQKEAGK